MVWSHERVCAIAWRACCAALSIDRDSQLVSAVEERPYLASFGAVECVFMVETLPTICGNVTRSSFCTLPKREYEESNAHVFVAVHLCGCVFAATGSRAAHSFFRRSQLMSERQVSNTPVSHPGTAEYTTAPYGSNSSTQTNSGRKPVTTMRIADMRTTGEKIAVLTSYDATFAAVADSAGVDCIMIGDSLGMVCQGMSTTVGVSLDEMKYHTRCVSRGLGRSHGTALVIADLPFGSYQLSREQAITSAVELMQAGANMVKLEGGGWTTEIVAFLVERGIPVCGHLGLTPQTVSAIGGYRVQGRQQESADRLREDARALDAAGASMMVLEMIPAQLAQVITDEMTSCATIGIGAGNGTAGQVLVMHDMLGINLGRMPKFVRNFMKGTGEVGAAFAAYVSAVKDGSFPDNQQHAW
jgi:3-methyl-2-oxobutanoate hydroxymethyltransferase